MHPIDVAVFDEHEIFRRGVVACLSSDGLLRVVAEAAAPTPTSTPAAFDVAVVSASVATSHRLGRPLVVCSPWDLAEGQLDADRDVFAVLARHTVTPAQLASAVRAAAVGLQVQAPARVSGVLDRRGVEVLRLLAEGAATREISERLGYSERTIKGIIHEVQLGLGARSRAHAVATALRERLI